MQNAKIRITIVTDAYAMLVGAEAVAGAILLDYWDTPVPTAVWITIILIVTLALNIFAVGIFGEAVSSHVMDLYKQYCPMLQRD